MNVVHDVKKSHLVSAMWVLLIKWILDKRVVVIAMNVVENYSAMEVYG